MENKNTIWMALAVLAVLSLALFYQTSNLNTKIDALAQINGAAVRQPTAAAPTPSAPAPSAPAPSVPSAPAPVLDMQELMDDDAVKGDPNAPVTIIEWSDFECPFCARFYEQTLGQIESTYIETGKVKLVYRDFPLSFHPNAQKAAEAAECAGEQDAFWEMHDLLFERGVSGGVEGFKQYAAQLGLDADEFATCLDSGAMAAETAKDMADGSNAGVRGTPGFIVNGQLVSGAQPFSAFKSVIDAALSEAGTAQAAGSGGGDVKEVTITMFEWGFEQSGDDIEAGDEVRLTVKSTSGTHGLALPAFGVETGRIGPGEEETFEFTADREGSFEYYCNVPCGSGHRSMKSTLEVQ